MTPEARAKIARRLSIAAVVLFTFFLIGDLHRHAGFWCLLDGAAIGYFSYRAVHGYPKRPKRARIDNKPDDEDDHEE